MSVDTRVSVLVSSGQPQTLADVETVSQELGFGRFPLSGERTPHTEGLPLAGQLWVALRKWPTEKHFDPTQISTEVVNSQGQIAPLRLDLLDQPLEAQVLPGIIRVEDRVRKTLHHLTFGAFLQAKPNSPAETLALFTGREGTPILDMNNTFQHELADIFLAQMARRRAEAYMADGPNRTFNSPNVLALEKELIRTSPAELYLDFLVSLEDKPKFRPFVFAERQRLQRMVNGRRN